MDKDFQDDLDSTVDSYLDIDVDLLKRRQKIVDNEKSLYEYKMERKAHGKKRVGKDNVDTCIWFNAYIIIIEINSINL